MRESRPMVMNKDEFVAASMEMVRPRLRKSRLIFLLGCAAFALLGLVLVQSEFAKGMATGAGLIYAVFGIMLGESYRKTIRKQADDPGVAAFYVPYRIMFDENTLMIQRENGVVGSHPWWTLHKVELKRDRLTLRPASTSIIWADREAFSDDDWAALVEVARSQGKRFSEQK